LDCVGNQQHGGAGRTGRGDDRCGEHRVVKAVDEGLWVGAEATTGDQRPERGDPERHA
jgi:hypothetical protein